MFFAAKEAVERKARERGRREGIEAGRQAERERISNALESRGLSLPPEIAKILSGEQEQPQR